MNMAFDEKGRLWVTVTKEYPFPVPVDQKGRDAIKILEDTDGDGRADKITTFVEGLNIPTGIAPYQGGAVAWSIPNIWHFPDKNGDGHADDWERLFGPLGWERDTHGMNSSFTRGFDGWVYATHGFNNNTTMRGRDGHEIKMNSGNSYRFRFDGSRVEQFTWGQVNPFGLCFDPLGNLYSADCHSEPVYALLRGAYYPSFGKPHDGLGFGPSMIFHEHGSTAISGIIYYSDATWPEEFRDNVFTGNVMTSRIDRDAVRFLGTSPTAQDRPAFLVSDDPWFRPVNLLYGPDGALYIADFYNRIIGHYEVPLPHPGRDRTSGRIWRVAYASDKTEAPKKFDLSRSELAELIDEMGSPNITRRMLAMNQVVDRIGSAAVEPLKKILAKGDQDPLRKIHSLWALYQLRSLDEGLLVGAAHDRTPAVRVHAMRILSETPSLSKPLHDALVAGLRDSDPLVQRCAADALGQHPAGENIAPLLELRARVPSGDTHLLHVVRMALRNQLVPEENFAQLPARLSPGQIRHIADVAVAIPSVAAGKFLLAHLKEAAADRDGMINVLRHATRYAPEEETDRLAAFTREQFRAELDFQWELFHSIQEGAAQRGTKPRPALRDWGVTLAGELLDSADPAAQAWSNIPVDEKAINPWAYEKRNCADGKRGVLLLSSFPRGETQTGVLRSKAFPIPRQLTFYLAGQSGIPGRADPIRNFFRLRDAQTGEVLAETPVPRNDIAQKYTWELARHGDRRAYLEAVDGDSQVSYAWLAFGRIEPAVAPMPVIDPSAIQKRQQAAVEIVRSLQVASLTPRIVELVACRACDAGTRSLAAQALLTLDKAGSVARLAELVKNQQEPEIFREKITEALAAAEAWEPVLESLVTAPWRLQVKIAAALVSTKPGAEVCLKAIENGRLSPQVLLERTVRQKLDATNPTGLKERVERLTRGLTPLDQKLQARIDQRRKEFDPAHASAERGALVFKKTCAVCHQLKGEGAVIGPQLDGIGNRGLERVMEDVLDPSRNVDRAFRVQTFILKDGDVTSGLPRREEGELQIVADSTGKEISIAKKDIQERRDSESSLMPDNLGELLPIEEFNDLIAFLLAQRAR